MPDGPTLLLFAGASLALLAVPGPAVIYVVTRSVDQGRTAGFVSVLGIETGTFAYALAAAAGLTGLIAASETGFSIIKYVGAAYLIYLGVRKLLARDEPQDAVSSARSRLFLNGMLIQLLNPKIAIFFLAFLPQFVDRSSGPIALQILVLGTIFTVLAILSDGVYVLVAGAVGNWLRSGAHARRALEKVSGGIYIGLGVSAALTGTSHARAAHSSTKQEPLARPETDRTSYSSRGGISAGEAAVFTKRVKAARIVALVPMAVACVAAQPAHGAVVRAAAADPVLRRRSRQARRPRELAHA